MPSHLLLIFTRERRVGSVETLTAADLAAARERALATMQAQRTALGYELWRGGKKMDSYFSAEFRVTRHASWSAVSKLDGETN